MISHVMPICPIDLIQLPQIMLHLIYSSPKTENYINTFSLK